MAAPLRGTEPQSLGSREATHDSQLRGSLVVRVGDAQRAKGTAISEKYSQFRSPKRTDAAFFAYSWKLPAYSGACLLTAYNFGFFTYSWSFSAYSFCFLTYS